MNAHSMPSQPLSILIAALGGEGGSVLMNWIVEAARASGLAVQATSVPGVAQRTGSTSYYIEIHPAPQAGRPEPVFALFPMPGRVDVAIASEHLEAARLMERGFVSPKRTTLIMSTSRVYTTAEKNADGGRPVRSGQSGDGGACVGPKARRDRS
jgi:indolepyruvate ferredoxin oxidoreductase, beta subunit